MKSVINWQPDPYETGKIQFMDTELFKYIETMYHKSIKEYDEYEISFNKNIFEIQLIRVVGGMRWKTDIYFNKNEYLSWVRKTKLQKILK